MALVFGFGGVRDYDGELSIDPAAPSPMAARSSSRCGSTTVSCGSPSPTTRSATVLEEGEPLELTIRGGSYTLTAGETVTMPAT